ALGYDPNLLVRPLHPYGGIEDSQPAKEQIVQISDLNGTTIDMVDNPFFKRLRTGDRFFVAYPYEFGHQDNMVVVLDENPSEKTFTVPMYRRAVANTTLANNSTSFNAYDADSGATAAFSTYFGSSFKFDNYKALMRAKRVLDPSGAENALLF